MKPLDIVMNKSKDGHHSYASVCFKIKDKNRNPELVTCYGLWYKNCNPFVHESYGKINYNHTGRVAGKLCKRNMRQVAHKYFGTKIGNIRRNDHYSKYKGDSLNDLLIKWGQVSNNGN